MKDKLNLILMVDTSGSMKGKGIGAVNDAVLNVIQVVENFARIGSLECSVTVLCYGDDASYDKASPISDYVWKDASATGVTSFGKVCRTLLALIDSKKDQPNGNEGRNLMVLFSDGTTTDDHTGSFCRLIESVPFQRACRVAIAIGRYCDEELLAAFTGDSHRVILPNRIEEIQSLLYGLFPGP